MKTTAAVLYGMGKLTPYAKSRPLEIEEIELAGPDRGEVLVEVAAAGLCHSDLSTINGTRPRVMPMVMGHEASGIVREVGEGVTDFQPDDHVVFSFVPSCGRCLPCATGRPALCRLGAAANTAGTLLSGRQCFCNGAGHALSHHLGVSAFSQHTVAAQESLVRIDRDFSLRKAALFGCAVLTGVGAVLNTAKVEPGASVAVFGMGGVGLSSILGAVVAGAWPIIAVDTLPAKLDAAKQAGATYVVNAKETDPVQAIQELTGGGASYVFEAVGHEKVLAQACAATGLGGKTVAMGLPDPARMLSVPVLPFIAQERTLVGSYMGSAVPRRDIPRFIALHRAGRLPVDHLFSRSIALDDINEGFDALEAGRAIRQVVEWSSASDSC